MNANFEIFISSSSSQPHKQQKSLPGFAVNFIIVIGGVVKNAKTVFLRGSLCKAQQWRESCKNLQKGEERKKRHQTIQ
jgi:hypothetical protein